MELVSNTLHIQRHVHKPTFSQWHRWRQKYTSTRQPASLVLLTMWRALLTDQVSHQHSALEVDKFTCVKQTLSPRGWLLPATSTLTSVQRKTGLSDSCWDCTWWVGTVLVLFLHKSHSHLPPPWKSRTLHEYDSHHGTSSPPVLLFPQAGQGWMIHWQHSWTTLWTWLQSIGL